MGIGLAALGARLPVGAIHLDHCDALAVEVAGETGAVAAGAFDPDELQRADPRNQASVWR